MPDYIEQLQQENNRLKKLAEHDELTGIYNRRATERKIKELMPDGGVLLVCDLDYFKRVNDEYGHLVGDRCLQKTAELLTYVMRRQDIVGRIGGDEFVIFAIGDQTELTVENIRRKIENRFASYNEKNPIKIHLTTGYAIYQTGDSYETLFNRADQDLLQKKRARHAGIQTEIPHVDGWMRDMKQIRKELVEQIQMPGGAYCQDFESFKVIYRFLERSMRRSAQKACVVLISVVDERGIHASPENTRQLMDSLGKVIQRDLRMGDVYTRYSSHQYLILLGDVNLELAENIALRIRDKFLKEARENHSDDIFLHYCYQLEASRTLMPGSPVDKN